MRFILWVLLLSSVALGQSQGVFKGGVMAVRPVQGLSGLVALNFEVYGEVLLDPNFFSYDGNNFSLTFTSSVAPLFCVGTCSFAGTVSQWFIGQSIGNCVVQNAIIDGQLTLGGFEQNGHYVQPKYYPDVYATYSQVYCVDNGTWYSGGSVSIHLQ